MAKPVENYAERDALLRQLGFASYEVYQSSVLWAEIRLAVLNQSKFKCVLCSGHANQVHHASYSDDNLLGRSLRGLHPICNGCHREVEFNGADKLTLNQSAQKFAWILKRGKLRKSKAELKAQRKRGNPAIGLAYKRKYLARRRKH